MDTITIIFLILTILSTITSPIASAIVFHIQRKQSDINTFNIINSLKEIMVAYESGLEKNEVAIQEMRRSNERTIERLDKLAKDPTTSTVQKSYIEPIQKEVGGLNNGLDFLGDIVKKQNEALLNISKNFQAVTMVNHLSNITKAFTLPKIEIPTYDLGKFISVINVPIPKNPFFVAEQKKGKKTEEEKSQ